MESLNRMAVELVDEAIDFAGELGIVVHELDCGATVLDFGVEVPGGIETGLLLTEIQTGGQATVQARTGEVAGTPRTHVELTTDTPALACLCGQKAGWELGGFVDDFDGLGSGPARALVGEEPAFEAVGYYDEFDFAVLAVESSTLPGDDVARHVAERAGVEPSAVYLPTFAAGSITGSVAGAARAAELAVFRLFELGYDPRDVHSVTASAPVAPVADAEGVAIARTTDAVAYGGRAHLQVARPFDGFEAVVSAAGAEHGTPFERIFDDLDWSFEDVPADLFAPAAATVDVVGGEVEIHGERDEAVLAEAFGLD